MIKLYKGDCLVESDNIKSGSVDLILTDLPYGTMTKLNYKEQIQSRGKDGFKWDKVIDTNKIYQIANRILRKNGKMVLFSQQPFTTELINKAIPNLPYNYSMIWEKDVYGHALLAKKAPLNYYEDILVFSKKNCNECKHPNVEIHDRIIDEYGFDLISEKMLESGIYKDKSSARKNLRKKKSDIDYNKELANCFSDYLFEFLRDNGINFGLSPKEYREIDNQFKNAFPSTFNLWEGNKYKSNILKYKKDYTGHHPTQKPILLLEDLIKTFSNENDLVVDFTMGSGSTGVACENTKRNFIGIEKDENYFKIAEKRIKEHQQQTRLF